nr:MOSC N-terminal beta barrel domain protein [uncultured bacterium]
MPKVFALAFSPLEYLMSSQNNAVYGASVKDVVTIAWPVMLSMASHTIMDVTDTLMVGWIGTKERAAIGIATTVLFLLMSFFMGLFEGVKILGSQHMGAGRLDHAWSIGINGLFLVMPCALVVVAIGFFSETIFALFGGPKEIQELAVVYFNIRVFAPIFWFITLALTQFFQGLGDTKTPMRINVLVCLLNIAINPFLIFGLGPIPALGVAGSALATVLSTAIGSLIFLWIFFKKAPVKKSFDIKIFTRISQLGWPSGIRWFCDISGYTVFTALVARLGEVELAANQICIKIVCLSILPIWGVAEATCILTGYHFGGGRYDKIKQSFYSGLKVSCALMVILGVVFIVGRSMIVGIFEPEPAVFMLSMNVMLVVVVFQFFESFQNTCSLALYGTGDTRFPMLTSLCGSWFIMLPLAYGLGFFGGLGLVGMWIAATIHLSILSVAVFWRFMRAGYMTRKFDADTTKTDHRAEHSPRSEEPLSEAL